MSAALVSFVAASCIALSPVLVSPTLAAGGFVGRPTPRIVGGSNSSISELPFQVALYEPSARSVAAGFFCGGVIIDATHVATAAHCLLNQSTRRAMAPASIAVLAGSGRLNGVGDPPYAAGVLQDPVLATSFDPDYEPTSNDYDVGVLTLAHALWVGSTPPLDGHSPIAPIAVDPTLAARYARSGSSTEPVLATVSGWGDTRSVGGGEAGEAEYPRDLQSVRVPLVSPELCAADYANPFSSQPITEGMICAGNPEGGQDACFGDSGGPLVVDRSNPAAPPADYVLEGLVSFGEGCAQPEGPGVYASIADPGIAGFLLSDPPQAPLPEAGSTPTIGGTERAGRLLTCRAGAWLGTPTFSYRFYARAASGSLTDLTSGFSLDPRYRVRSGDAGSRVLCTVLAVNAGGYSRVSSPPTKTARRSHARRRRGRARRPSRH